MNRQLDKLRKLNRELSNINDWLCDPGVHVLIQESDLDRKCTYQDYKDAALELHMIVKKEIRVIKAKMEELLNA